MKTKEFIKATWELPQNALGAIVKKVCKAEFDSTYNGATVYSWNINGGMSLGKYIFVPFKTDVAVINGLIKSCPTKWQLEYIKHEYGHTVQSKYLGWFYLLVIGAPSLIWANCFEGYRKKTGKSYYDFYTESWANKLGGVEK